MAIQIVRYMILLSVLFSIHLICESNAEETVLNSGEDDDSSSEETVEDTVESDENVENRRRRRFVDQANEADPRVGIPGLPNPATIIKIAEILQSVGEQVVPILLEGIPSDDFVGERFARDLKFLRNLKKDIETFSNELKTL